MQRIMPEYKEGEWQKMIDIKFLRENPEIVKENIRKKFQDVKLPLVDEVIEYDEKSRTAQGEADQLRAERKKLSKQIEERLQQTLHTKVSIQRKRNGHGKLQIDFYSSDDLEKIIDRLTDRWIWKIVFYILSRIRNLCGTRTSE